MRIYVGQLPFSTTDEELKNLFSPYGEVVSSRIIRDWDTGRSRGFGFIEMQNSIEGQKAIDALNGTDFGGRNMVINEARPHQSRPQTDRGR